MIVGNLKNIDLSTSSFERMITGGKLYVDKTRIIEHFLLSGSTVQLITRQRRLGKSLNMDTLRCFLTSQQDYRHLFKGLYIESSPIWGMANSAPTFYFNFKGLTATRYESQIRRQVIENIYSFIDPKNLEGYAKLCYDDILEGTCDATETIMLLTKIFYEITGKTSYILIDEYDRLLMEEYDAEKYNDAKAFLTRLLSSALKDNPRLEKAMIIGVMRISYESMFSGLNNIETFDIFNDNLYTDDYGLTEEEIDTLSQQAGFDIVKVRDWYNGVKINGHAIYNTYSMMSYLSKGTYACYWGKSGTMDMIVQLLNDDRRKTLAKLLAGDKVETRVDTRISIKQLFNDGGNEAFYSLLVQGGYLAMDKISSDSDMARISIPNKELMIVWKSFILSTHFPSERYLRTLFDNADNPEAFRQDLEYFITDRLSYHDIAGYKIDKTILETLYHIFLLGLLSAYDDIRFRYPLSNRESGHGRYDILVERASANYIFEFKAVDSKEELDKESSAALDQISAKRYGHDLGGYSAKPLVKVGVAMWGKLCRVRVG